MTVDKKVRMKRHVISGVLVLFALLAVILAVFGVHCSRVRRYNATLRTVTAAGGTDGVAVGIHPCGQATDSWQKNDAALGAPLTGTIYELTVSNGTADTLDQWSLRLDIPQPCYLNNAWCGTVEIHQFADGEERVQTLDLRNCDRASLTLKYLVSGGDLLIPLSAGDYLLYYPNEKDNEMPIVSMRAGDDPETVNVGLIFYSTDGLLDFSGYTLQYYLHRSLWIGTVAVVCRASIIVWSVYLVIFVILTVMIVQYEHRLEEQDTLFRESLDVFSSFVDAKDPYTYGHSRRVAYYSGKIAQQLGLPRQRCEHIYYIAMLHDIGKCYVPDEILKKPSALTPEEYAIVKQHPLKGAGMVRALRSVPEISDGVLYHHERYDGTGYPTGKKGTDIPLVGRIIAVADAYDAMSSDRVYRSKLSHAEILEELHRGSGTQFDPAVVEAFLQVLQREPENTTPVPAAAAEP